MKVASGPLKSYSKTHLSRSLDAMNDMHGQDALTVNLNPGHLGYHRGVLSRKDVRDAAASQHVVAGAAGLEDTGGGIWSVHFGPMLLGRFDEPKWTLSGAAADNQPL